MKESYWQQKTKIKKFPALDHDIETDVLIIGGGLTGLMCAYFLKDSQYHITLVEGDEIGSHSSSHMTGKISYFQPSVLKNIKQSFSELTALRYFKSNLEAYISLVEIIEKNNIQCDFSVNPHYFYSVDKPQDLKTVYDMLEGSISTMEFTTNQIKMFPLGTFDPVKYMKGIVETLDNVNIYEHTKVLNHTKIQHKHVLKTGQHRITAKYVVVATRYPIFNFPSMYFLKMHQVRSALFLTPQRDRRIVLCEDDDIYSRRNIDHYNLHVTNERLVGDKEKPLRVYDKIQTWHNQDCISHDGLPMIGYYDKGDRTMFVATGYNKWGITMSHVAGKLISELILNKESEYQDLYEPHRFKPITSASAFSRLALRTMKAEIVDRIVLKKVDIENMDNHSGTVTDLDDTMVAVYKENGHYYGFVPVCSHLGCILKYNSAEHTFECPCHGSRFDYTGKVLDGPAIESIESTIVTSEDDNNEKEL